MNTGSLTPNPCRFRNNKTCSHSVEAPAPKNKERATAPVNLNRANRSLTKLLNLARGSSESNASKISITGVALVANLRFVNININAINEVAPTSAVLVIKIFIQTLSNATESNQR